MSENARLLEVKDQQLGMDIVFKTQHGSHLYGLAHSNSDEDYYIVVNNRHARRRAKQSIHDGIDTMLIDLTYWLHLCEEGVPQALEAMFAPAPAVDRLGAFRRAYRCNVAKATRTYRRTIRNFAEAGDFKKSRHALRLWLNLEDIQRYGRFNPLLSEADKEWVTEYADSAQWFLQ
jgi:hypothetical protein